MMVNELLILLMILSCGNYKERNQAQSILTKSELSYSQAKELYKLTVSDPESHFRLKEIARHKWQVETLDKYTEREYYNDGNIVLEELQEKDFIFDIGN